MTERGRPLGMPLAGNLAVGFSAQGSGRPAFDRLMSTGIFLPAGKRPIGAVATCSDLCGSRCSISVVDSWTVRSSVLCLVQMCALFASMGCGSEQGQDLFRSAPEAAGGLNISLGTGGSNGGSGAGGTVGASGCSGVLYRDVCWHLAQPGQSCSAACQSLGGTDSRATGIVGSTAQGGDYLDCAAVLTLLGYRQTVTIVSGLDCGCYLYGLGSASYWSSSPDFSPDATKPGARIACGCSS